MPPNCCRASASSTSPTCWPAPIAAYQLALLGADVIKVEPPAGGDLARQLGASPELNKAGMGASFLAQNAGKRSVVLDSRRTPTRALPRPRRHRRRAGREFPAGRHGPARPRLRAAEGRPARPRLLRHLRLRPDRADARQPGLRPDHPGPVRHHEHHRHAGDRAAARRLSGLPTRWAGWSAPSPSRRRWCARSAPAKAPSSTSRCWNARLSALGWPVSNYLTAGVEPRADGQREHDRRALRRVPHRRRPAQHRRQQAGAVRGAVPT